MITERALGSFVETREACMEYFAQNVGVPLSEDSIQIAF